MVEPAPVASSPGELAPLIVTDPPWIVVAPPSAVLTPGVEAPLVVMEESTSESVPPPG